MPVKQSDLNKGLTRPLFEFASFDFIRMLKMYIWEQDNPEVTNRNPIEWMMPNDLATWPLLLSWEDDASDTRNFYVVSPRGQGCFCPMTHSRSHVPPFQQLFQRVLSSLSLFILLYFVCVLSNCSRCSKEKINNQPINNETDQLSGSQLTSSNGNFLSSFGPLAMLVAVLLTWKSYD